MLKKFLIRFLVLRTYLGIGELIARKETDPTTKALMAWGWPIFFMIAFVQIMKEETMKEVAD